MHSSDSAQCVSTRPPICRGCNMRKGAPGFSRGEVQAVHVAHSTLNTELDQFVRGVQNERGSAAGFNHSSPSMPLERLLLLNQCLPCFNHHTLCNAESSKTLPPVVKEALCAEHSLIAQKLFATNKALAASDCCTKLHARHRANSTLCTL